MAVLEQRAREDAAAVGDGPDPWHQPEADPAALRYELDSCRAEIARLRAEVAHWRANHQHAVRSKRVTAQRVRDARHALAKIVDLYQHRPETRSGGAVAIAAEALGHEDGT